MNIKYVMLLFSFQISIAQNMFSFTADTNNMKNKLKSFKHSLNNDGCLLVPKFRNTKIEVLKSRYFLDCSMSKTKKSIQNLKDDFQATQILEHTESFLFECSNHTNINDADILQIPSRMWHLNMIQAQCAWGITTGDTNVIIGIADTDFQNNHPDFQNKFLQIGGIVSLGDLHGTLVAGFIAPATNNSIGTAGIGFNCRMDGQRVYHYQIGGRIRGNPADAINNCFNNGDRIINVSNSSTGLAEFEAQAFVDEGAVLVVGAGNQVASTGHENVGNIEGVLVVSAVDENNSVTGWAARNQFVDICAPGQNLFTTHGNGGYGGTGNGTSYSAPIVAGVVGLMRSANPCLTPQQIHQIIQNTADPILGASQFPNQLGAGRINAYRAVKEAVTRYVQNQNISTSSTQRAFVDIGSNVTNTMATGAVNVNSNSIWNVNAREVYIKNDFEVPLGSELNINTNPNFQLGCN